MKNFLSSQYAAICSSVAITLFSSGLAHADRETLGDAYLFADVGFNRFDVATLDESSAGASLGIGYEVNETLAIELAYNDFGEVDVRSNNSVQGQYELTSVSLAILAGGTVGVNKYAYGIFGVDQFEDDVSPGSLESDLDEVPSDSEIFFGIGLDLSTDAAVPARITITSHAKQDLLRLTAGFRFF